MKNGKLHRGDDSINFAVIDYYENGQIQYEMLFVNHETHTENGPAIIEYYKNGQIKKESWYINEDCHREDSPINFARIEYYENGQISSER